MKEIENTRKKAKDYRKEYSKAKKKLEATSARIKKRCIDLCERYPSVVCDNIGGFDITAKSFLTIITDMKEIKYFHSPTERMLNVIQVIEKHIDSQHPHQQGELFGDKFRSANPSNPDAIL